MSERQSIQKKKKKRFVFQEHDIKHLEYFRWEGITY